MSTASSPAVGALGYLGITTPAVDEWRTFGPEVLGLEVAPSSTEVDDTLRFRVDDAAQRITVRPGERHDLDHLGWTMSGPAELAALATRVEAAGITVHRGDTALAADRRVAEVAWFTDPFGFRHELSWGLLTYPSTFRPGRAMSGFVTGEGGLGHVVLMVPELAAASDFLTDVLGMRLSDCVEVGRGIRFFHCNRRHHTIAITEAPGMAGLHHLMMEVRSIDDVGTALDLCQKRGHTLAMTLGRHTNDLMTSFYVRCPSGFEIEYGCGGLLVDDEETWEVRSFAATSIWGHHPPAERLVPGILRRVG